MLARLRIPATALWSIALLSAIMLGLALIAAPIVVSRLPSDYFAREGRSVWEASGRVRWIRWLWVVVRNLIGLGLLSLGVLMLVLPGQGVFTILISVMVLSYPGKHRLLRWIAMRRGVSESMNWVRRKANQPPLEVDWEAGRMTEQGFARSKQNEYRGRQPRRRAFASRNRSDQRGKQG
jgi:small-conductance mechanosensitive channel